MSVKKSGKAGKPQKGKDAKRPRPTVSISWKEHEERVMAAIAFGTGMFMLANEGRIAQATSAESAKNSYVTGMIDLMSVARNALGFWGANQILQELERLNAKRSPSDLSQSRSNPGSGDASGRKRRESVAKTKKTSLSAKGEQRTARGLLRDPMFA